jgi:hypothetical protein
MDAGTQQEKPGTRLDTFVKPVPSPALIRALVPVNRVLCLGGIPGLRSIPGLARIPGITGLSNVVAIDFPPFDEARLRDSVAPGFATFITPNHPEFFTDWMLDKEILTRIAPRAASWATHMVVNGMGGIAQAFWLKNNLIAQIPGAGGSAGRAHSVDWALAGHGVLLHPEGQVGWHGDTVGPLFPGAVEMASEAAAKARAAGRAMVGRVAPVVWKLKFLRDAATALEAEIGYVERRLRLDRDTRASLPERVAAAWRQLFLRHAARCGIRAEATGFSRLHAQLEAETLERLDRELAGDADWPRGDARAALLAAERWLRREGRGKSGGPAADLVALLRVLQRMSPRLYPGATVTQEQVAECIKRLRNDHCKGSLRDTLNAFMPQPAGPRRAFIRVPEPIDIAPELPAGEAARLVTELRTRMQSSIDAINATIGAQCAVLRDPNPFS